MCSIDSVYHQEEVMLYGQITNVDTHDHTAYLLRLIILVRLHPSMMLLVMNQSFSQIHGSGWISSTCPNTLSFMVHITQCLTEDLPCDDIAIHCYVDNIARFLDLEDLHSQWPPYLYFSGKLFNCQHKILHGNCLTTCLSITLD